MPGLRRGGRLPLKAWKRTCTRGCDRYSIKRHAACLRDEREHDSSSRRGRRAGASGPAAARSSSRLQRSAGSAA